MLKMAKAEDLKKELLRLAKRYRLKPRSLSGLKISQGCNAEFMRHTWKRQPVAWFKN